MDDDPAMARKVPDGSVARLRWRRCCGICWTCRGLNRPTPVACEQVSFEELGRSLGSLFEPICAQRDLSLEFEFDREMEGARTDRKLVTLILRNLIENASKFAFEGTTIRVVGTTLEVELEPDKCGAARQIRAQASREREQAHRRSVVCGRAAAGSRPGRRHPAHQERVFERYYQVDLRGRDGSGIGPTQATTDGRAWAVRWASSPISLRRGTGLGLAIVSTPRSGWAGGSIERLGQGTTAWAEIPVEFGDFAKRACTGCGPKGCGPASGAA